MLMLPHHSTDFAGLNVKVENEEVAGLKRTREVASKDDLAISEGIQSFGRNFSMPEIIESVNKRQKKETDQEEDISARNRLLDSQLLLDHPAG